jgi:hypothetical protein
MGSIPRRIAAFLAFALCATCAHSAERPVRAEPHAQRTEAAHGLERAGHVRSDHARPFSLEAPSGDELAARMRPPHRGLPLQLGFDRDVAALATAAGTGSALQWERKADGSSVAAVTLTSPGAESVRAALRVTKIPAAALVRFQAPGDDALFEVTGAEIADAIERNLAAGASEPAARTYWSPLIEGDAIVLEIDLPAGSDRSQVQVAVPKLSHLLTSAAKEFRMAAKSSAACEVDAMCSSGWTNEMNSVARMIFSDGTGTFACTGTLLADQDPGSDIPYFLSANHCISAQAVASSLTTFWFFRSSACNSGVLSSAARQLAGGAALLYHSTSTDTSFMRLNNAPPAGAVYSGWFVGSTPAAGSAVTGLHHPQADLLKISGGAIHGYEACSAPASDGTFTCGAASASNSTFFDVRWSSGVTEGGSSGSGLFLDDGHYLVGQLFGGSGDCTTAGADSYGRFDVAFNASLKQWLSSQALGVTTGGTGSGKVTSSPSGIDCGTTCSASYPTGTSVSLSETSAAGSVFTGWSGACTGTGACSIKMDAPASVVATFDRATAPLTVVSTGAGTVTSAPAGIACGTTCTASFTVGTAVTLAAAPSSGMFFSGWGGPCSGTGTCVVSINAATTVSAAFAAKSTPVVSLQPSVDPTLEGRSVLVTASVSGALGVATGTVSFTVDGAAISGCAAVSLASGAVSCSLGGLAAGTHALGASYNGDARYFSADAPTTTLTVSPPGTVQLSVLPKSLGFGGQSMATTSPPLDVTVTNSGAAPVTIGSVAATAQFAQSNDCGALAVGASCHVHVTFDPAPAAGPIDSTLPVAGSLVVTSDATNSPGTVMLAGTAEKSLVTHYYQSILRRPPDASGKQFWTGEAARVTSLGANVNETWYAMGLQFYASPEYAAFARDDAGFVSDLYNTFFARAPDAGGLAFWTGQLASGMPRGVVLASFLFSTEFGSFTHAIFGDTSVRAEIDTVMDFYRGLLARLPDDAGFAFWVRQFRTAQCEGPSAVAAQADAISASFIGSSEYSQRGRTNAEYVGDLYNTFLRRGGDVDGVSFWIGQLDTHAQTRDQVRRAFIASPEFAARVDAIVAQGCLP